METIGRLLQCVEVAVRWQRLGQRGAARQDGGEELVELLRNGARQPADRLHLLGLLQGPLARQLRGDVFASHRSHIFRSVGGDRKSTRLNSSHGYISYAVFCLKKKKSSSSVGYSSIEPLTAVRRVRRAPELS